MRRSLVTLIAVALLTAAVGTAFHARAARAQGPPPGAGAGAPPPRDGRPGGPGGPGGPGREGQMRPYVWDAAHADTMVMHMLDRIKGKENMPAESVYENIKLLNGMPAKRLPEIMVKGFHRGQDPFGYRSASDERGNKRVARQMWAMTQDLNKKYLPAIKDLEDDMPAINCYTCHRGQHDPETDPDHPHVPPPGQDAPKPASAH